MLNARTADHLGANLSMVHHVSLSLTNVIQNRL